MSTLDSEALNLIDLMLEDFSNRLRAGENPSIESYIEKHPTLEREIRQALSVAGRIESVQRRVDRQSIQTSESLLPRTTDPFPTLTNYRFIREIGRGGMGVVFEAEHIGLRRCVALKMLASHLSQDANARKRFQREARAASKLQHPNIVSIHDVGEENGLCFFTMPLVHGITLDQIILKLNSERKNDTSTGFSTDQFIDNTPATPIGVSESSSFSVPFSELVKSSRSSSVASSASFAYYQSVAKIGRQMASAIAHAHQRGVLHRDIKPANVLLDAQGTTWISDFGLAKNLVEDSTMTGDLLGTLRYMAPERFEGQCDERSDIYGIGLVLFELSTLSPAVERLDRLQTITAIRNQSLPEPRQIEPKIPIDLNTIISKAIGKDPKSRYATAAKLAEDLDRFLNHEPILARRISSLRTTAMWCQRNPMATSLVTTTVLFLLIITLGSLRAAAILSAESKAAQLARDAAIASKVQSDRSDWESQLMSIKAIRTSRRPGQRFETLKRVRGLNSNPVPAGHHASELRAEAFGALCNADLNRRLLWTIRSNEYLLCISDDFRLLATVDPDGNASVYDVESKTVLYTLPGKGAPTAYDGGAFSPDNRYLAVFFPNTSELDVWNILGAAPQLSSSFRTIYDYTFSPDATRLALLYREHRVEINRLSDGELVDRIDVPEIGPMEWNPCFGQIAVGSQTIDLATHRITNQGASTLGRVNEITWHPNGKQACYSVNEDRLITWDTELNREVEPSVRIRSKGGLMSAYNHSGTKLLTTDWTSTYSLYDAPTGDLLLRTNGGQSVLSFSKRDNQFGVDSSTNDLRLFDFASGDEMRVTAFHKLSADGSQMFVADRNVVSSDGRWMITKVSVGSIVFDLARGEFIPGVELPGTPLCFEPSGHLLMYNPSGLMRWNFQWDELSSRLDISWDDQVFAYRSNHHWDRSPNGLVLAIPRDSEGTVLGHIDGKRFIIDRQFGPQREVRYCAISPDERFLATGSHGVLESDGPTLKVWDLGTGECILQQRKHSIAWPQFTSDGRWLFVIDPVTRVLRVGTWEEVVIPDIHFKHVCFSPNGKFIVNSSENGYVQLLLSKDLSLVANLAVPFSEAVVPLYVSDEADRFIVRTLTGERFASFDVRSIHNQLVELNPKWSFLAKQDPKSQKKLVHPEVVFDAGELGTDWRTRRQRALSLVRQADDFWNRGDYRRALQCLSEAVELDPTNYEIANELAWFCLVGPDALKSPDRAIKLGLKITEREPNEPSYANTLAFAYLQNGQYKEAIAVLDRLEKEIGYAFDAFDGYCKAICLLRLGKPDEARSFFKMAEAWQLEHASTLDSRRKNAIQEFLQTWETALAAAKN